MPSNYRVTVPTLADLDNIFLPRTTAARANVSYKVEGIDISDRYQPGKTTTPTGYKVLVGSDYLDLSEFFAGAIKGIEYRQLFFDIDIYNVTPNPYYYNINNDGKIEVEIRDAHLNSPLVNGLHTYKVSIENIATQTQSFSGNIATFVFTGLNSQTYTVTVQDLNGIQRSVGVTVGLGGNDVYTSFDYFFQNVTSPNTGGAIIDNVTDEPDLDALPP